jgi:hypothetical protein
MVAIINPWNGPGSSYDSGFATGISELKNAGIIVIGYVATGFGSVPLSSIENQETQYHNWYAVNGIFFDEMQNAPGWESYYASAASFAGGLGMNLTFGNPGTSIASSYVGTLSVLIIYENQGLPTVGMLSQNTMGDSRSNFGFIAYGVGMPSQSYVDSSSGYVGWVYLTDAGGSNPYDALPSYLSSEIQTLAAA